MVSCGSSVAAICDGISGLTSRANFTVVAFDQVFVGVDRGEDRLGQTSLLHQRQQVMLVKNRVAQDRQQHLDRLSLQQLKQFVPAGSQCMLQP